MSELRFELPEAITASLDGRVAKAVELAIVGGRSTLELFQSNVEVERKGDDSPVTIADKGAEKLIRSLLAKSFPDDAILGEEFGEQSGTTEYQWIIDPIDGTKSFISGVPLYSTLVGIVRGRECLAGVIYIPGLDEIVFAARGCGTWHSRRGSEPEAAKVSSRELEDGLFLVSQVDSFQQRSNGAGQGYLELEKQAYITRSWGDGYGYLLVATGRAELMVDPIANPWDLAAVQPVVEEAGGSFTSWSGEATVFGGDGVGSNGKIHRSVLDKLNL
ncbi:MAG: inositol monophosphatase family protein [Planctomycetota bacterium]